MARAFDSGHSADSNPGNSRARRVCPHRGVRRSGLGGYGLAEKLLLRWPTLATCGNAWHMSGRLRVLAEQSGDTCSSKANE
eukprot:scaffold37946_cov72-Phaeocystis_antarctica.AAC.1